MLQQINNTHSGFEKSCPTCPTGKPDQIQPSGKKVTPAKNRPISGHMIHLAKSSFTKIKLCPQMLEISRETIFMVQKTIRICWPVLKLL